MMRTLLLLLIIPSLAWGLIPTDSREGLTLAIVQDQFLFNFDNIKNASLINNQDGTFKGLLVELKQKAIANLTKMTAEGFNKEMVVIFNNKVISSTVIDNPLGGQVLFSGLSLADAQTFLMMLHKKQDKAKN